MNKSINWSLVGIPDHQAVLPIGGRLGAALGPEAIWEIFRRMSGLKNLRHTIDGFTLVPEIGQDTAENHSRATSFLTQQLAKNPKLIVLGGSHDHASSHITAIQKARPNAKLGCINLDAHLDLRPFKPQITSGSPFSLLIENRVLDPSNLIEFGIQRHCNSPDLWAYAKQKKIRTLLLEEVLPDPVRVFSEELDRLSQRVDEVILSLDLDCIEEAQAPGV